MNIGYFDDNQIAFRVIYKPDIQPYIFVNGNMLSRPHSTKDISTFFEYICNHPNKRITTEELQSVAKISLKKGMDDILRDLGFRGVLAKLFFREMTNNSVYFVNPVLQGEVNKLGIDWGDVSALIHTPKRKGGLFPTT